MAIKKDPTYLTCSARGCESAATGAIIWSNPKIHYARHKTWLCCAEHKQFLVDYLGYRNFPVRYQDLDEFLAAEAAAQEDGSK